jgi:hypothetical protein
VANETGSENLHVPNHSNNLNDCEHKFGFTVTFHTKQVDTGDENEEYCDEYGVRVVSLLIPEIDSNGSTNYLQRENHQPLQSIVL